MTTDSKIKPKAYSNPSFDEEPAGVKNSGGTSPMGSNIFIVNQGDNQTDRVHPEPYRHEPITKRNFPRMILRGIRCKYHTFTRIE